MKAPKQISKLLELRDRYIETQMNYLNGSIIKYQQALLTRLTQDIISQLDIEKGFIKETKHNYRLLTALENVYRSFTKDNKYKLGDSIVRAVNKIAINSKDYFLSVLKDDVTEEIINSASTAAKEYLNLSLGLTDKSTTKDGFIDKLLTNDEGLLETKKYIAQAITARMPMKDFTQKLNEIIIGSDQKAGSHERLFNRYARDLYSQYDAAYNKALAEKIGLKYFIYSGGLVKDSRDFCVAHNAKVYSTEEAKEWTTWTVDKGLQNGEFPAGYQPKAKETTWGAVPGYMDYPEYSPLIDRGGYNCRHMLGYISNRLAERMRPKKDLSETKNNV